MHLAAKKGNTNVIKKLFDHNANIYAKDLRNWTPLHYAAFNNNKECVHLLSRFDADKDKAHTDKNAAGKMAKDIVTDPATKFSFNNIWKASKEGNLDIVRRLI